MTSPLTSVTKVRTASSHPIDGDGDGWVLDGTPEKRPATPAEMAAGAKWRASRGAGGAKNVVDRVVQPQQAKMKFATNEYDARIDLYHRAIDQAVHSNDPNLVKKVQSLIDSDKELAKEDHADLHAVLNARRDGQIDPKPVRGSNRDSRTGLSGKLGQLKDFVQRKDQIEFPDAPPPKKTAPKKVPPEKKTEFKVPKGGMRMPPSRTDGTDPNDLARQQRDRYKNTERTVPNLDAVQAQQEADAKTKTPQVPETGTGKKDLKAIQKQPNRAPADLFGGHESDPENSPAGKELEDGKRIEDVTDTTGLLGYIADNPEQFEMKTPKVEGGTAETVIVKDKDNGRLYFFKMAENDPNTHSWGDGVNEVMSGKIAEAAFPGLLPQADFIGTPSDENHGVIRSDHVTQFAKDHGIDVKSTAFTMNGFKPDKAAEGEDKRMLALHIFDYLSNQSDRHDAGVSVVTDKKGQQHYIGFDQGGAFHSHDTYLTDTSIAKDDGIEPFPPEWATDPEGIDYAKWLGVMTNPKMGNKGGIAHGMTQRLYEGKEDQLKTDAEEILKQMHEVPLDQLIADLRKRFPNLPGYENGHLEGMARIWKSRLKKIKVDDVVKGMK
jgi:hypothetical protein